MYTYVCRIKLLNVFFIGRRFIFNSYSYNYLILAHIAEKTRIMSISFLLILKVSLISICTLVSKDLNPILYYIIINISYLRTSYVAEWARDRPERVSLDCQNVALALL